MEPRARPGAREDGQRLEPADREWAIGMLAAQASRAPGLTPQQYLRELLDRARWPERWREQWSGAVTGNAPADARQLVEWAAGQRQNPDHPCLTTLGSLLAALLDDVGLAERQRLVELLVGHCLCHDQPPSALRALVETWAGLCQRAADELLALAADPAQVEAVIAAYCHALMDSLAPLVEQFVDQGGARVMVTSAGAAFGFDFDRLIDRPRRDLARWLGGVGPPELTGDYRSPAADGGEAAEPVSNVRGRLLLVKRGVLLGEPGSGKSWTLLRLLAEYAARWLAAHERGQGAAVPIPVLVLLNAFTGEQTGPGGARQSQTIAAHVQASAQALGPYLPRLLKAGRIVVLCDALNEMPRQPVGVPGRDLVAELRDYLTTIPSFLVSCRVRDYRRDLDALAPLEQVRLLDLELPQIREIARRRLGEADGAALWKALGGSDQLLAVHQAAIDSGQSADFWDAQAESRLWKMLWEWGKEQNEWRDIWDGLEHWRRMHQGARLIPLCRNPYLLGMISELFAHHGRLPGNRAELFGLFVAALIEREATAAATTQRAWPATDRIEAGLERLAAALQERQATTVEEPLAQSIMRDPAEMELLEAAVAANLLTSEGGRVRFSHQLLQEYFAARVLLVALEGSGAPGAQLAGAWWDGASWRETVVILGELLSIGEGAAGPNRVARWLAPHSPELAWEVLERNGTGLSPADVEPATTQQLIDGARGRTSEAQPVGRAAAYRVLGRLEADARPGVGLRDGVPDLSWRRVPAGPCPMGGDPAAYNAWAGQMIDLPYDFWIARYPVTVAQYAAFVADGGYTTRQRGCWTRAGWQWKGDREAPALWANPRWHIGNHPVVGVSWYEAYAYTRWLVLLQTAGRLRLPDGMPAEHRVRLATEAEWEKAARWPDGRVYPYGSEYDAGADNTDETGIGRTSAVGVFAGGAAACGAEELSGNVWEWCLSAWQESYRHRLSVKVEGTAPRVLRGGSWYDFQFSARAASRFRLGPVDWVNGVGFRVVVSAPLPAPGL